MSTELLRASVVIPAFNAEATIGECVTALNHQTLPRHLYEVIVVDDGSTDQTATTAASLDAQVFRQTNCGPGAARNKGIAEARGAIILFTDADCAPASDWIAQMMAPLSDPSIAGSKGVYRTRQKSLMARFIQVEYEDRYDHTARQRYVDFIDTYAAAYRRDILIAAGGFDAEFTSVDEDQELSFRLAEAGHKMVFAPLAIVYHHHAESWQRYARRKFRFGYWKAFVLRQHPQRAWRDSHTPPSLKLQIVLAALSGPLTLLTLLSRVWGVGLGIAASLWLLSAAPFVHKAWQRDRSVAWVSLPALYLRAWALGLGLAAGYSATVVAPRG